MKNLLLRDVAAVDISLGQSAEEDDPIAHFCLDTAEGLLYAVTGSGLVLCSAENGTKLLWSARLFEVLPELLLFGGQPVPLVVAFSYVLELDAVFIVCSSGELLLLHAASHEVEEVGVVAGGLAAAAWSPDGELLALLGYNQLLLLMNKEWDVLAEVPVPAPTQAASATADAQLLTATLTWRGDSKYFASNTSWQLQTSSSNTAGTASDSRLLHIWDREDCQLHATGEPAAGLAAPIAWQPNSRHLFAASAVAPPSAGAAEAAAAAATAGFNSKGQPLKAAPHQGGGAATTVAATKGLKQQSIAAQCSCADTAAADGWMQHVLLFERNGLQHGGFDVPTYSTSSSSDLGNDVGASSRNNNLVIQAMHWSIDSELLAIVLAPVDAGQQQSSAADDSSATHEWHVQVWHRSNWHWYLKHEQLHTLPESAGALLASWDDIKALRLHLLTGSGAYTVLDFDWAVTVSGRGTAAVVDGHQLLITPLRHCQVPPPMCAVRAVLPRPINALAWFDGNIKADLEASSSTTQQQQHAVADVAEQGLCEVLAVLLSDSQLLFLRSVESDLWEETLEDQVALGGPKEYLLPLGYSPATCNSSSTAAVHATASGTSSSSTDRQSYLSMTSGPWTPLDENSSSNTYKAAAAEQVHQLEQQYLPVRAPTVAAGDGTADSPAIPLAEGRLVMGLVWLSRDKLLLLAAPYPAEEGLEEGEGTVLVEVSVQIPTAASGLLSVRGCQVTPEPETQTVGVSYAGSAVMTAAAHPAGGALLQLQDGQLLYHSCDGKMIPLSSTASFPVPCRTMLVLPDAAAPANSTVGTQGAPAAVNADNSNSSNKAAQVAATAPAVGLSAAGGLYWGQKLVASDVISVAVRGGGPGGPALLFTTRQALLFVVMVGQLPNYQHTLPDQSSGVVSWKRSEYPGDLRAAMSVAMRPGGAAAGAREPHIRAVEPGAMVLASPWGDVGVILQMQRGNLEGFNPRLLTLAAICDALESHHYSRAWDLAVTNRVDLNLLVDYAWPRFLDHAQQFVAAVQNPSDLCDLLFALQQSSVLQEAGMYTSLSAALGWQQQHQAGPTTDQAAARNGLHDLAGALGQLALTGSTAAAAGEASDGSSSSDKVSAVCAAIRAAVVKLPGRYLQGHLKTVVMSYVRSDPPSLESALVAIREVKEAATGNRTAAATQTISSQAVAAAVAGSPQEAAAAAELSAAADAALKHLLLYVDVDLLYRTALGLYDLTLAFMVVSHSQKDPGEYLAELTSFGSQDNEHLRCHAIDMSLARYDRALGHLVAAGHQHFEAALRLATEKGLLRQLLALVQQQQQGGPSHNNQQLVAVMSAYGDALMDARKAEDAAVAYSAAGLTKKALGAYKTAGSWRMCMVLAARLGYSLQQQQLLARELSEQLQASGSGGDAAQLLVAYLGDVDGGVSALVTAKEWREALRVAYAADRSDLVDTIVVPTAAQAAAAMLSEATESIERLQKYTARLKEVRQRRIAMEAALAAADAEAAAGAAAPDDDLMSESPSMISGFSVYTDRTAAGTGIGGSSIASSSRAASTIGGRRPLRSQKKAAKKGKAGKIRAGSPGEETALAAHLETLVPPKHVLEEAGQLAELLVILQHVDDASKLQQRVGQWQAAAALALEEVAKGQQQQQQGVTPVQQQAQQHTPASPASDVGGVTGSKPVDEVRWKWDVLREHR